MDWDIFGIVAIVLIIYVIAGVGAAIHLVGKIDIYNQL